MNDYSDLNFRYLKATGLFQSKGRAITLVPEKQALIDLLVSEVDESYDESTYVLNLWSGAKLPTDDKIKTIGIIHNLIDQLAVHGLRYEIKDIHEQSLPDLSECRHQLEERLQSYKELVFAGEQAARWQEIADFMKAFKNLSSKKKVVFPNGEIHAIPRGEAPAYFEWIIWRAFLAIDSMDNKSWEARKFKIDQDFLPLSHAPANGPDMEFVFEEYVLVVEVTLTTSSRQEAVEGEPVRRHVAKIAEHYENRDKKVYCLFIALDIDSNTAETFKIGSWYKKDGTKLPLQIVPITLDDFINLFEAIFKSGNIDPMEIRRLLVECRVISNSDAPEWKRAISTEIKRFISNL